jgi:putative ABC transport system permease protein
MIWGDIRYGCRMLARNPGFTAVVILVLGLGIGAATSVFSIVNGVLLQALPYKDPGRLVMLFSTYAKWGEVRSITSGMNFLDWQKQSRSFEDLAVVRSQEATFQQVEGVEHVEGMCVSTNLFSLLGWEPLLGRTFLPEETWPNHHYVVLGYDFWKRHLNGDEAILGKAITLRGIQSSACTVVGVMPPGIRFLEAKNDTFVDFWIPVDRDLPELQRGGRGCLRWHVVGRLKKGVNVREAQAEMGGISERIAKAEFTDPSVAPGVNVVPLHDYVVGGTSSLILLAGGGAGLVLLIACANVGSLLLARGLAQRRELATRAILGARWLRLLRQAVTESLLLSLLGGVLGILLAFGGVGVFRQIAPSDMVRLEEIRIDPATLGFALCLVLLMGILVGLVPALRTCRPDLNEAIKADSRGATADFRRRRLASLFVAFEISLCLVLLISSGLLVNSLSRLLLLDPGYRTDNVLTARLENMRGDDLQDLLTRIRSLPGVRSAAIVYGLPLCDTAGGSNILPEGRQEDEIGQHSVVARIVSPGYFHLMGISLLSGHDFAESDTKDSTPVTIINESLARRFWTNEDPIGKRFEFGWAGATVEIIGVARDTRSIALDADPVLEAFVPARQLEGRRASLVVAAESDPAGLVKPLSAEVRSIDANAVIREVRTMADIVARTLAVRRLLTVVLSVFSCTAVVLASLGIYGVIAYSVRRRTAEIGIRMALGATSRTVLAAVLKQALGLAAIGVLFGLAGALAATRVLSSFLYGVSPTDPLTFAGMTVLLVIVALMASYVPARRAAQVDPMVALRCE